MLTALMSKGFNFICLEIVSLEADHKLREMKINEHQTKLIEQGNELFKLEMESKNGILFYS